MEVVTNADQRYLSYAGGELMLPLCEMVTTQIEHVRDLEREQHELILKNYGVEVPAAMDSRDVQFWAMTHVQLEWFKATSLDGSVPEKIVKSSAERIANYERLLEEARLKPVESVKPAREPKAPRELRPAKVKASFTYEILSDNVKTNAKLATALDMKTPQSSHDGVILQELERVGTAVTLDELVKEVAATGRYTSNDPLEKSVKWHLGKLVEKQYVKATEVTSAGVS